ncbi:hypothetical protein BPP43_06520 [Brachyspira pilosicoli P43/6/78]|uniref:Lipoprotein n=1 Tax=Brachyspira pilosicoli P43/6/78 TaxID=1042417 RepID=A0A3B6VQA7_BRAPL|nr:hypothetical protein [Brachyspira pilosicoli]AGA66542.1 hypothetical protein BPP43_06520 [Brachyspira pilosicoli P43/6/78]SUW08470.1 lipoprotein [Brachyspira pilosicoli]
MFKYKIISLLFLLTLFNSNLYSVKVTVLPFLSKDKEWVEKYMVDDGMPRAFEISLRNTHMFDVSDYDLLISYFESYDNVMDYKALSTNITVASDFVKDTFESDYLITGEVLDFNLKQGGKDTANVEFKVNLIDINTAKTVKTFTNSASYVLPGNSVVYNSEDALFYESALGWATILAFNNIANEISEFLEIPPLIGTVTRIEDNKIFINLGKRNNIKIGDEFGIYSVEKYLDLPPNNEYLINKINERKQSSLTNGILTNNIDPNNFVVHNNTNSYTATNQSSNNNNNNNNKSNISKQYNNSNNASSSVYRQTRENANGDFWYTSEMLYIYRYYKTRKTLVTKAKVIELYDNYAILENKSNAKIELLMEVKINEEKDKNL